MPARWAHTHTLADQLHETLRDCVEQSLAEAAADPDAVLVVDRVRRKLDGAVARARIPDLESLVDLRLGELAESALEELRGRHSDRRLKDVIETLQPYRVQRIVRARLEERKWRSIVESIASGRVTWESRFDAADEIGAGLDERALELPLAFEVARFGEPGRVLDAGAALNRPYLREVIDPPIAELMHFTQSGDQEDARFAGSRVSYVFGDLRATPFRDGYFDRIVCISTLEHVGMDNQRYGGPVEQQGPSMTDAVQELTRVLAPGGTLLITVPYGPPANHGWFRVLGPADVRDVLGAARPAEGAVRLFRFAGSWVSADEGTGVDLFRPPDGSADAAVTGLAAIRICKAC